MMIIKLIPRGKGCLCVKKCKKGLKGQVGKGKKELKGCRWNAKC